MRLARITLSCFSAWVLFSCGGKGTLPAPSASTPVFLITIDTLRSDHLPMYGYGSVETPALDALRKDAVLYEQAYSHTPLTLPSHSSILTGVLPAEHGVRDNLGFSLSPSVKTIAEVLRGHGYATGAAVSAFVLRREAGLNRGFDFYDDAVDLLSKQAKTVGNIQRDGASTEKAAIDWITKQKKPVFFFLHLYEPHTPYTPPEPYASRYASKYDGEIAYADSIIGDYIAALKAAGLYDKALIILLADHGEGLKDHGEEEHGLFLYREAIQIPLLVKLPDQRLAGASVGAPAQIIDVVPTILERTGIAAPAKLAGTSLALLAVDKSAKRRAVYSETYYPRFHYGWSDQHSLIDGARHYIQSPKPELFDLTSDLHEKTNVYGEDRRGTLAMRNAIAPFVQKAAAPSTSVSSEDIAKLAALGYLGSTVQTKPDEILPDPKDHLDDFRDIGAAFEMFQQRKYDESLALTDSLLKANPRVADLYDLKSKTLMKLGRNADAVEAGKDGLRLSPNSAHLALDVASLLLSLDRLDDARKHAELALKLDPSGAHSMLSRIAIERKDWTVAEKEARLAVDTGRETATALLTLARVQREQQKYDAALATLDQALRAKKSEELLGLHFIRGDVLARLGRADEAESEFRTEIEKFPEDPAAYKNLVLLLVAEQRIPEGTALIRQLIAEAPTPPSYVAVCQLLGTLGDQRGVRYWALQGLKKYPHHPELVRLAG